MLDLTSNATDWTYLAEIMKTLGHPIRLHLVAILSERDANPSDLAKEIRANQAVVSQHLSILRMRGLVSNTRVAGRAVYTLEEIKLRDLIDWIGGCQRPVSTFAHAGEGT